MITIEKLKEYQDYRGYYDGFYIQKVKAGKNLTTDKEWYLIAELIQDIKLVQKSLTSNEFSQKLDTKLKENCDSEETIIVIKGIALKY